MDFDRWSKSGGVWSPYPSDAPEGRRTWDSANRGLSVLGVNPTTPEYSHVAVSGDGKAAARIESRKVLWAFVGGNLFTGRFERVVKTSGAEISFGVPFRSRPRSMSGYYHYLPGVIDYAKAPYESLKGSRDKGFIEVFLTDWSSPRRIDSTKADFIDVPNDPHVIGWGRLELEGTTDGYVRFDIPIEYSSSKTPSYIVVIMTPSGLGEHFTGSSHSVLYADEFRFNY